MGGGGVDGGGEWDLFDELDRDILSGLVVVGSGNMSEDNQTNDHWCSWVRETLIS